MASGGAWARAALVMVAVIALDQGTKALVRADIAIGDRDGVFPGVEIVHVRNEGVAFSRFSGGGTVVAIIVGAALLALVAYFVTHLDKPLVWLPTGMLLGGALGNVIDRLRDGAVTDFIKLPGWPAFNVADIAITFGVLVLLYVTERPRHAAASDA
ncbi:MAG TPA: signal peptidase II [Solirubrobacteraceae bacterium]